VNSKISKILAKRKQKISKRLKRRNWEEQGSPMFKAGNIRYEVDARHQAIASGGIGAIHLMNSKLGFVKAIDQCLHLLKCHLPYHESDHVLNIAYNVLAGGTRLEDIDLQRQDEAWLNALGAEIIPDPTTSGDFLRRFGQQDIVALMEAANQIRKKLWQRQPKAFLKMAIINIDGTKPPATASRAWTSPTLASGDMRR